MEERLEWSISYKVVMSLLGCKGVFSIQLR